MMEDSHGHFYQGDPVWVAGVHGSAVELTKPTLIQITAWVNYSTAGQTWQRIFDFGDGTPSYMFLTTSAAMNGVARFAIRTTDSAAESMVTASGAMAPGWHPLAVVIDSETMTMQLYRMTREPRSFSIAARTRWRAASSSFWRMTG